MAKFKANNATSHKCITRAAKVLLEVSPTISNQLLSEVLHNEFSEVKSEEVVRSIHLAIWWFNNKTANLKRNYKNL